MLTPSDSIMNFTELLRSSWPEWGCLSSEPRVPRDDSGSNNLVKQRAPRSLSTSEACLPLPPSLIHSLPHLIPFSVSQLEILVRDTNSSTGLCGRHEGESPENQDRELQPGFKGPGSHYRAREAPSYSLGPRGLGCASLGAGVTFSLQLLSALVPQSAAFSCHDANFDPDSA